MCVVCGVCVCVCVCVLGSAGAKPIGTPCILGWRSFLPTEKRDSDGLLPARFLKWLWGE